MIVALVVLLFAADRTEAQQDLTASPLAARLDALAHAYMTSEQVPGAIAAIVSGDEAILRGYGVTDVEAGAPVDPNNTRFEIGSITKLFTWVAVMMLVEEGALDLQADVSDYLRTVAVPGSDPLTLAQLMSHRPGYEESYAIFNPSIASLPRPEALAASAPEQIMPRGEITAYSNWGVALVGQIIEDVSGMTWEAYIQMRILDPLGMQNTTLGENHRRPDQPPLSRSYWVRGGFAQPSFRTEIGAFAPAGGIASTASDMAKFLRFMMSDGAMGGTRLLQPETVLQMRTRLFDDRPQAADMAHGLQSKPQYGTMVYGHGGGLNDFLSNFQFIPEIQAGVFISQNGGIGASLPLLAPDLVLAEMARTAGLESPAAQPPADAEANAKEAAGRYLTNRRTFSGPAQVFAALSPLVLTELPGGTLLVPTGTIRAPSRFEPIAPDLWEDAMGHRIQVIRDADGQVVRLADGTGAHTHERLRGLADPNWLLFSFVLALLFSVTTLLGLLWRHGLVGITRSGTVAAFIAVAGAVGVLAVLVSGVVMALTASQLGAEFLFVQPQPTAQAFLAIGSGTVVIAGLAFVSLPFVWRTPEWSVWRRLHQTAFALSLVALSGFMLQWGIALGGPI
ncbi:serine hydrolase domain-containing protein [Yoonia sp.]|uniref:serine hydrolase domain-containing protein n=1 Tax=Yoonia sp. TaxID=2212373 RepID=UPI00358E7D7A